MKSFDISNCLKPMISKVGMISSRKNKYYIHSIQKCFSKGISRTPILDHKIIKVPLLPSVKKQKKILESSSFKAVGRITKEKAESLPPNRYSPRYEYLYKQYPRVIFGKEKNRDIFDIRSSSSELSVYKSLEIPSKIQGIPFEKQIDRKAINFGESPHEKRFEREQNSSFEVLNKIHSFESYTYRKPLYETFEYQPEYSPKYSFISKKLKTNKLLL